MISVEKAADRQVLEKKTLGTRVEQAGRLREVRKAELHSGDWVHVRGPPDYTAPWNRNPPKAAAPPVATRERSPTTASPTIGQTVGDGRIRKVSQATSFQVPS